MMSKWSAPILLIRKENGFVHDLLPITPLGHSAPITETIGAITLAENTNCALASAAARLGQEDAAIEVLTKFLGTPPPAPAKIGGATFDAFWMGPDQWMIIAPFDNCEDLAFRLAQAANGTLSVTEQTDAWCRFDLAGPGLSDVFELLCPVNTRTLAGQDAQRTSIDHLGCFLLVHDADRFSVIGPRSSAGSLHHALVTAIKATL